MLQGSENKQQNVVHTWAETRTSLGNPEFIPLLGGLLGKGEVFWWGNPMRSTSIDNPVVGAVRAHGMSRAAQSFGWLWCHCLRGGHQATCQQCGSGLPLAWINMWLHNHPGVETALLVVFHQWRQTVRWTSTAKQASTSGQEITQPETWNAVKILEDKSVLCSRARERTAKLTRLQGLPVTSHLVCASVSWAANPSQHQHLLKNINRPPFL